MIHLSPTLPRRNELCPNVAMQQTHKNGKEGYPSKVKTHPRNVVAEYDSVRGEH
jgi:hypothetical protein